MRAPAFCVLMGSFIRWPPWPCARSPPLGQRPRCPCRCCPGVPECPWERVSSDLPRRSSRYRLRGARAATHALAYAAGVSRCSQGRRYREDPQTNEKPQGYGQPHHKDPNKKPSQSDPPPSHHTVTFCASDQAANWRNTGPYITVERMSEAWPLVASSGTVTPHLTAVSSCFGVGGPERQRDDRRAKCAPRSSAMSLAVASASSCARPSATHAPCGLPRWSRNEYAWPMFHPFGPSTMKTSLSPQDTNGTP